MLCPKCSQPANAGAQFCGACGQRLETSRPSPNPDARLAPAWSAAGAASVATTRLPSGSAPSAAPDASTAGVASASGDAASARAPTTAPGFVERVKNMLFSPRREWTVVAPEGTSVAQLVTGYVVPLTVLAAVISLVHLSMIGVSVPFGAAIRMPLTTGLTYAVLALVAGVLGVFLVGIIINALAPTFGGTRDQRQALKTAAYSLTPAWISAVFSLLPAMGTLLQFIAGLYGIYLLYLGLPVLMRSQRERAVGYTASVVVCTILLGILFGVAFSVLGVARVGGLGAFSAESRSDVARERAAATAANILGSALGTDDKGKAGLASALSNMAKAGEQMQDPQASEDRAGASGAASDADASSQAGQPQATGANQSGGDASANALGAAGGLLTALGGALGGGRHVAPVDFHTLEKLLPASLPGMTRVNVEGNGKQALGVKSTSATATYQGGGTARIQIEIADASGVSGLMDLADSLVTNESSESDAGYERQAVVAGRSVHEKYDRSAKHGEASAIVAKRFTVDVTGDSVDMQTLEQTLGRLDLAALEALRDAGAGQGN